jgi:hypothetical protein
MCDGADCWHLRDPADLDISMISAMNVMHYAITLSILHFACLGFGVAGLMFLGIRKFVSMDDAPS